MVARVLPAVVSITTRQIARDQTALPSRVRRTLVRVAPAAALMALTGWVVPAWPAGNEVVIRASALDPPVLRAAAGQRVTFIKGVQSPVHVEFGSDPAQHQVFQAPLSGPVWAVFHRPGTHPYVVHIYDTRTTVLRGVVEVVEDPERPWAPGTCGAVVMEVCIEP